MISRPRHTFPLLIMIMLAAAGGAIAGGTAVYVAVQDALASDPIPAVRLDTLVPTVIATIPTKDTPISEGIEVRTIEINTAVTEVVDDISPAVVTVLNLSNRGQEQGSGSGVIFSEDGYLLTNNHVIEGANAKKLIPIHTQHDEYHKKWHSDVHTVNQHDTYEM